MNVKRVLLVLLPSVTALALLGVLSFPGRAQADPLPGTIVVTWPSKRRIPA